MTPRLQNMWFESEHSGVYMILPDLLDGGAQDRYLANAGILFTVDLQHETI